jgi:nuclear pore complex protein Nup205
VDEPDPTQPDPFDAEFVPAFLESLEILLRALVRHASWELRKIKQRQEDVVLASARVTRGRLQQSMAAADADVGSHVQRNHIGDLYTLFGALYSSLPLDRALQSTGRMSVSSR